MTTTARYQDPMEVAGVVPMTVVMARAATVCRNRGMCRCGRKRVPGTMRQVYSRRWIPCERCLGTIEQVS